MTDDRPSVRSLFGDKRYAGHRSLAAAAVILVVSVLVLVLSPDWGLLVAPVGFIVAVVLAFAAAARFRYQRGGGAR